MTIGAVGGMAPIDPIATTSTVSVNVADAVFDRLVIVDPSGSIAPGLAEAWTHSEDFRTWDFALRTDATFHDGQPVTADDVVYSLEISRRGAVDGPAGATGHGGYSTIEAVGRHTVRVGFSESAPASFLYHMRAAIMPRHAAGSASQVPGTRPPAGPVGSGPFRVDGWEGDSHLRLVAFEEYWGGRPRLDTVYVKADYQDTDALWAGLMRGEVDIVARAAPEDLASLSAAGDYEVVRGVGPGYYALMANCRPASPLSDRRVREALSRAIDRQAIWRLLSGSPDTADSSAVLCGPFPPGSRWASQDVRVPERDVAASDSLLNAAGWAMAEGGRQRTSGRAPLSLSLGIPTEFAFLAPLAAQLRKDLEEVGIQLVVRGMSYSSLCAQQMAGDQGLDLVWGGGMQLPDPDLCAARWHSASPDNCGGYTDDETDRLIEEGRAAYDPLRRTVTYQGLDVRLAEECPTLFVCRTPLTYARRKGLAGTALLTRLGTFRSLPNWYWSPRSDN